MWGLNCCMYLGVSTRAAGNQSSYQPGFGGSCINDVTPCRWSGLGVGMAAALSHWRWQKSKLHPGFICYSLMWHAGRPTLTFVVTNVGDSFPHPHAWHLPPLQFLNAIPVMNCSSGCYDKYYSFTITISVPIPRTARNALVACSKRNHQLLVCLSWGMNMQPCNFVATERSEG